MASTLRPRQPFGVLDTTRLQTLGSIKNRQNNALNQTTPLKAPSSAPAKRRLPVDLSDNSDSENIDPAALASPSKKSKGHDGTPSKVSKFYLTDVTKSTPPSLNPPSKRKAFSHSVPATTNSTPILHARGSDQRISLLKRRSMTPYRRQDPPPRTPSALPFSIDAALSGTISSYSTPAPAPTAAPVPSSALFATPSPALKSRKPAPTSWFFAIHEDSPDQEATNLLYHGASVLDISSDDDSASARAKDAMERGKENIPPPDSPSSSTAAVRPAANAAARRGAHRGISCPVKALKFEAAPDAMLEDRVALREMDVRAFWPADADEEEIPEQPVVEVPELAGEAEVVVREDTPERVEV